MKYSYPLMKDWVDYIDRKDGERGKKHYLFDFGFHFGDWLALDGPSPTSYKGGTDDTFIASNYYYQSAKIVADAAEKTGKKKMLSITENWQSISVKRFLRNIIHQMADWHWIHRLLMLSL